MSGGDDRPAHAVRSRPSDRLLGRSLSLVRFLRAGCPWDARQTPETLRPYLLEEAHETADAVRAGDERALAGELGDLLLNVAFQIVLAEERDAFDAEDVVRRLEAKMEARHPHVYGGADEPPDWEEMKARERSAAEDEKRDTASDDPDRVPGPAETAGAGGRDGSGRAKERGADPFEGLPDGLEPLSRALRCQQRAAGLGFDWPSAAGALAKLREEVRELEQRVERDRRAEGGAEQPTEALRDEVGDVLFAAVSVARLSSVHPMRALERAVRTFERRFREVVRRADESDLELEDASLEELEAVWRAVKDGERGSDGPSSGA